jgi:trk system potassium uptake protein TrkH
MKYFGQLLLVVAALTLFPLAASLISREISITLRYSIVVGGLGLVGWLFSRKQSPKEVQVNEGIVLVASVFLAIPFVMSYPLMASGLHFSDAFFEAVSGVTTTGLSTLKTVENKPTTFLFSRARMQWYGGLGIVVLSLALLFRPGQAAKKLSLTEAKEADLVGGTKAHARRVFTAYGAFTRLGILLLLLTGVDPFIALIYTLASVSTGGYAPYDASLRALGGLPSQWVAMALCLACPIPLSFYPVCNTLAF